MVSKRHIDVDVDVDVTPNKLVKRKMLLGEDGMGRQSDSISEDKSIFHSGNLNAHRYFVSLVSVKLSGPTYRGLERLMGCKVTPREAACQICT